MRYRELFEAPYDDKIIFVKKLYPEQAQFINSEVKWTKNVLKTDDGIAWWIRNLHITMAMNVTDINRMRSIISHLHLSLEHFFSMDNPLIRSYHFGNKYTDQVINELSRIEERILQNKKEKEAKLPVPIKKGDYKLFEYEDGHTWWFVDRAYCPDEGKSGKHCGNVTGKTKTNQKILSFRKNGRVILTFILEPNGFLGEMKEKGNKKPNQQYHRYIIDLLLSDMVKGISGGGFLKDKNFSIFDLDEQNLKTILKNKPTLIENQISISPAEFYTAPDFIKNIDHYKKLADESSKNVPKKQNNDEFDEDDVNAIIAMFNDMGINV